jgi:hypothetical protein
LLTQQGIARSRVTDASWWMLFLMPYFLPHDNNSPLRAYDMICYLTGKVSTACRAKTPCNRIQG